MGSKRLAAILAGVAALFGALLAAGTAQAATINPTYWDFGFVQVGNESPVKAFVTTGQAGDSFTAHPALLGFDPDAFLIVSDDCAGKLINGPEDVCTTTVSFAPEDPDAVGDMSAILSIPGYGQPSASLQGSTDEGEGGGGKGGPKEQPSAGYHGKCKKKKYRQKHKKKCRKQKQSAAN